MRTKQIVFNELYELFEAGSVVSVEIQEEAHSYGIRIEDVENAVLGSKEFDCDE